MRVETRTDAEQIDFLCRAALVRLGFASVGELQRFWDAASTAEVRAWLEANPRAWRPVRVQGADGSWRDAVAPADIEDALDRLRPPPGRARVLNPFDPLVRDRARLTRLFGFDYRIEIYVPAAKRRYGYYVYPVLDGARPVGRLEARAVRGEGRLAVTGWWPEPGVRTSTGRARRIEPRARAIRAAGGGGGGGCAAVVAPTRRRSEPDAPDLPFVRSRNGARSARGGVGASDQRCVGRPGVRTHHGQPGRRRAPNRSSRSVEAKGALRIASGRARNFTLARIGAALPTIAALPFPLSPPHRAMSATDDLGAARIAPTSPSSAAGEAARTVPGEPTLSGVAWLALYPLAVLAPILLMLVPPVPTGRSFWVEMSVALGFVGLTQIGIQFVLIGRFRPLTYPYGLDVVLKYHRQIALVSIAFVLLHPVLILIEHPARVALLNPFGGTWASRLGIGSVAALVALAAASIWRERLGIRYELWRVTHTALGISALVLAQAHVSLAGLYVNTPWKQALWIGSSVALVASWCTCASSCRGASAAGPGAWSGCATRAAAR